MIEYEDGFTILFRLRGSVFPFAFLLTVPSLILTAAWCLLMNDIAETSDFVAVMVQEDFNKSQVWSALTASLALLIAFRTRQALQRFWEGTTLMHQMRGEWFDSVSCLISFSRAAKQTKPAEVQQFRHTLVRLASVMHGSALDEICGEGAAGQVCMDITGLDMETLKFLRDCIDVYGFNKVEALQHMIQNLVTYNQQIGVLTIPPPILSRVYQTLSRGFVNLLNAKKIADTRFPFPWAQIILLLILSYSITTPLVVAAIIKQYAWAMLVTFIPVFSVIALNIVCTQLEMPFGSDANDLPLDHFQEDMNRGLLLLIHEMTDHIVSIRPFAQTRHSYLMKCVGREAFQDFAVRSTMSGGMSLEPEDDDDVIANEVEIETKAVQETPRATPCKASPEAKAKEAKEAKDPPPPPPQSLATDAETNRRIIDLLSRQLMELASNTQALESNTLAMQSMATATDDGGIGREGKSGLSDSRQLIRELRQLLTQVQLDSPGSGPVVASSNPLACGRCVCETSP